MKNHDKHLKYEVAQELGISYRNQKGENNKNKKQKKEISKNGKRF